VVELNGGTVIGMTFEPGWRWSECAKPVVGGDSREVDHFKYCICGRMHSVMDDGDELDIGPGGAMRIPPGYDAWIVGNEPYVAWSSRVAANTRSRALERSLRADAVARAAPRRPLCGAAHPRAGEPGDAP
jgi:hypothetical protein